MPYSLHLEVETKHDLVNYAANTRLADRVFSVCLEEDCFKENIMSPGFLVTLQSVTFNDDIDVGFVPNNRGSFIKTYRQLYE